MNQKHSQSFFSDNFLQTKAARIIKWIFVIAAYGYLAWKLYSFDKYAELNLEWIHMNHEKWKWLIIAILLMPLNWFTEAVKWKLLTYKFEKIKLIQSFKAVLAGICTGFFTPNRIGEPVGRILYLHEDHRKAGITMSIVSSITQTLVITMTGLPATLSYFYITHNELQPVIENFILYALAFLIGGSLFYFYLPRLSEKLAGSNVASKVADFTQALSTYSVTDLLLVIFVALIRYIIFCSQFYFVLHFFGINLKAEDAMIAIPANYLFITFTPTFAFSEAVVRSSFAVLFIGFYSSQTINIALAGIFIWLINFIIPMIAGSFFVTSKK